jgi:hypothetical protein
MEKPNTPDKNSSLEIIQFENKIADLMLAIGVKFSSKIVNFQVKRDADFVKRKDRQTNDIHLFFQLKSGRYFHLRAYTRHMLDINKTSTDKIFLTGYLKSSVDNEGGEHSFRQAWYEWNPETVSEEIEKQNPTLFQE